MTDQTNTDNTLPADPNAAVEPVLTPEQEAAFSDFNDNKEQRLEKTEKLLSGYAGDNAAGRFVPRTLLFERDGAYAILLDDKEDEDDGIVVCLLPMEIILSQNEYL